MTAAGAAEQQPIYWAGYALTGSAADGSDIAPHATALIQKRGVEALNGALIAALHARPPANLQVIEDQLARLDGSTSATVLAAALDRELVSVENLGGKYKLLAEVAVQALFFDFREKQVIAAYPVTLQYIDSFDAPPTAAQIDAAFERMLYGDGAAGLSQVFAQTLANARLPSAAARRLQVAGVEFSDAARAELPDAQLPAQWSAMLAGEFTKILSAETGIGLLPAASGQAIGGAMAARFADGSVYQLKIPDADYRLKLHIDRFATRPLDQTAVAKVLLFGVVYDVSIAEPLSGKVFFDQPLRKAATKTMPASQSDVDVKAAWYETTLAGLAAFSSAAAGRVDGDWLEGQQPGGRQLRTQLSSLQELIKSCR
ncbi:MAG: hypothetical protein LBE59_03740 [Nevskiaceae bacterium]|nr:hypothetical protein [Nevskiaceae bacterium]